MRKEEGNGREEKGKRGGEGHHRYLLTAMHLTIKLTEQS